MVLKGVAGPRLLDSYEAERKPVAKFTVEQAYTRYVTRTATYLGATDYEPLAHDFNVELGYIYHSPAVVPDDSDAKGHDDPRLTLGRPGARAPHLFVERDGKRISTLDLFGRNFVLLAAPDGAAWCEAGRIEAARLSGLQLDIYRVGSADLADPENRFCSTYGLSATGACLVRPDGFVGWRAKAIERDPSASLTKALHALLGRP
jgi:putative polyketide hydroxylase